VFKLLSFKLFGSESKQVVPTLDSGSGIFAGSSHHFDCIPGVYLNHFWRVVYLFLLTCN